MGSGARRALGAAVAACMLLCGCTPIRVVDPDATAPPSPSPSPSAGTAAWRTSSELPEVVTFAAGDGLRSGPWRVGWNHTRLWGGGYTYVLSTGSQDEGLWNYTQTSTGCDILLIQDHDVDDSDDLTASDAALAVFSKVDPTSFGDLVFESTASISGTPSRLQFHSIAATREGTGEHALVHSTRVLATADTELSMRIECPEGADAIAAANLLLDELTVDVRRPDDPVDFEATAGHVPDESVWQDSALVEGAWTLTTPDDGGAWGYTSSDGDCTVDFQQMRLDETDRAAPDDEVATDRLVAWWVGWPEEEVAAAGEDGYLGYGPPSNRILSARALEGDDGARNWALMARAFRQPGLAFFVDVWCTQRNAADALEEILGSASVVPPGW
ncbi:MULTISPECIES: hypothetical protein [unclassified Microbacterium]|uniref:hypothetical protein n=1 Tax=unclassified Microbacterium TaxID=2609290 RepID=UPI00300F8242